MENRDEIKRASLVAKTNRPRMLSTLAAVSTLIIVSFGSIRAKPQAVDTQIDVLNSNI